MPVVLANTVLGRGERGGGGGVQIQIVGCDCVYRWWGGGGGGGWTAKKRRRS
eukprot:COSAG01_NODE_8052_length_2938_cov_53.831631_1_plen_51_part_10